MTLEQFEKLLLEYREACEEAVGLLTMKLLQAIDARSELSARIMAAFRDAKDGDA